MHTTTPRTAAQLVADAKQNIQNLTADELDGELAKGQVVLVDLREPDERAQTGCISGAIHAPHGMLEFYADPASAYHRPEFEPERRVILHCASGGRSALAAVTLSQLG